MHIIIIIIIIHLHSLFGRVVLLTKTMSRFLERVHHLLLCVQLRPHFLEAQRKSDDKKCASVYVRVSE